VNTEENTGSAFILLNCQQQSLGTPGIP